DYFCQVWDSNSNSDLWIF
nr:immunoglobulin light chain junction region [Macaca mulatta]